MPYSDSRGRTATPTRCGIFLPTGRVLSSSASSAISGCIARRGFPLLPAFSDFSGRKILQLSSKIACQKMACPARVTSFFLRQDIGDSVSGFASFFRRGERRKPLREVARTHARQDVARSRLVHTLVRLHRHMDTACPYFCRGAFLDDDVHCGEFLDLVV